MIENATVERLVENYSPCEETEQDSLCEATEDDGPYRVGEHDSHCGATEHDKSRKETEHDNLGEKLNTSRFELLEPLSTLRTTRNSMKRYKSRGTFILRTASEAQRKLQTDILVSLALEGHLIVLFLLVTLVSCQSIHSTSYIRHIANFS